jgi:RimJ/RimL family protein N-acetyltransferase
MTGAFVPDDFDVPLSLAGSGFRLEPLGPEHNDSDHRAWVSSIEHIRKTPGFPWGSWPPPDGLSLAENLRDLEQHADDFRRRVGFTYTVLDNEDRVIGCVYIYPSRPDPEVTNVRSWVTASRAELDTVLHQAVTDWLATDWPLSRVSYRNKT